jgi:gluconokinase
MIILVMGVTGSGKTTIGRALAQRLKWDFLDADDFHSAANKAKMHQGIPLSDADRIPWLDAIHTKLTQLQQGKCNVVVGCSALKQSYRERLKEGLSTKLVYLKGSYELIAARLKSRKDHFADEHILAGQFADLEEPTASEATVFDTAPPPETIVEEIVQRLGL